MRSAKRLSGWRRPIRKSLVISMAAGFVVGVLAAVSSSPSPSMRNAALTDYMGSGQIPLPSGYSWRYVAVDSVTHLLYVLGNPNLGLGGVVAAVSPRTRSVLATIAVGNEAEGIAVDSSRNLIFVANYDSISLSVISGATNSLLRTVNLTNSVSGSIAVDQTTGIVYVGASPAVNGGGDVDAVNSSTWAVTPITTSGDGSNKYVTVDPTTDQIFVTEFSSTVYVINGANNSTSSFSLSQAARDSGRACLDPRAPGTPRGRISLGQILGNPATIAQPISGGNLAGGFYYIAPNGIGAAFNSSGQFIYFGRFKY